MSRIESLLVTGSSGFVGRSLLDYLATVAIEDRPRSLGLVSRKAPPKVSDELAAHTAITHIEADLTKPWQIEFPATHIVHLAADGSSDAYSGEAAKRFVVMTDNLISWSKNLESPTVFHASSGACFGHVTVDFDASTTNGMREASEDAIALADKKSIFVESRLTAENQLKAASAQGFMDLRIGRLFSFIGRHLYEKPHYAASAFVNMALNTGNIAIGGNPRTTRSYLSANDMSEWIYKSLRPNVGAEILSIGSEKPVTMIELANHIAFVTKSTVTLLNPSIAGDYYVARNEDTRARLTVQETSSWQTSIDEYIAIIQEMRSDEHR